MFAKRWKAIWNPDMYHGWGKTQKYFEGWYCKLVDSAENHALAVILGISFAEDGQESHAFIQIMDGKKNTATYHQFDLKDFVPSDQKFEVWLGNNFFSANKIILDLEELKGTVELVDITPWPKMLKAPGIMGWYSFVPFMECYHGVVSLDHTLKGNLIHNGNTIDFNEGIGYMEKDWGVSFPSSYIWMQSNHFNTKNTSLMLSVANIPWLGSSFIGFIAGLWYKEKLYKFATYTGAKQQGTKIEGDQCTIVLGTRKLKLTVTAHKGASTELIHPIQGQMKGKINESLTAKLDVLLEENGALIFKETGRNAGLEIAGKVEELMVG